MPGTAHLLNFKKWVEDEAQRWQGWDCRPGAGKDHADAQWTTATVLLFDDVGTELSTCSRTSVAMTHTTDGSAIQGEHYPSHTLLWLCFCNNHNNRTLFSTEREAANYVKPKSSLTHDRVYQPGHRTAQNTRGLDFTLWITRQLVNTGHTHIFITVTTVTDAQSEPGQSWTYRYKNCNELLFHLS